MRFAWPRSPYTSEIIGLCPASGFFAIKLSSTQWTHRSVKVFLAHSGTDFTYSWRIFLHKRSHFDMTSLIMILLHRVKHVHWVQYLLMWFKRILLIPEKLLTISNSQDVLVLQHTMSNVLACFCAKLFPSCAGVGQFQVLRITHYSRFSSRDCKTPIDLFCEKALVLLDSSRIILQSTKMLNLIRSKMLC